MFYTSGTTGKPKGIVHSGIAFVVNNYLYARYHLDLHSHDVLWCTAWGQTELSGCPLAGAAWLTPMKPGSCGPEFFGAELDVVDDEGPSVGVNVSGNLVIRQPFPMMLRGLWREPERHVRSYYSQVPGCYFTNDAAVRDSDGHFWVTGRVDDIINVRATG